MSATELVNLISSIASLILSVLAIWLSLYFYDKAKQSEKQTEVNVNDIKTQTRSLTDISTRMLDKYTDYATKPKAADESFLVITQLLGQFTSANLGTQPSSTNSAQLERYAIDLSIVCMFYVGMTNLATQDLLPQAAADISEDNSLPRILDASKVDFDDLEARLQTIDAGALASSDVYNLYQIGVGWKGSGQIRGMTELYQASAAA